MRLRLTRKYSELFVESYSSHSKYEKEMSLFRILILNTLCRCRTHWCWFSDERVNNNRNVESIGNCAVNLSNGICQVHHSWRSFPKVSFSMSNSRICSSIMWIFDFTPIRYLSKHSHGKQNANHRCRLWTTSNEPDLIERKFVRTANVGIYWVMGHKWPT